METGTNEYLQIDPLSVSPVRLNSLMLGSIAPRPIAFASTLDKDGRPNLSPFSFFNTFGINPPILVFSPSRKGRDNTTKHTYDNIREVPEVVINAVSYSMIQQMSLASSVFQKGVNEFEKAGFTMEPSLRVTPFRVKESPVQFECKVIQVIETGSQGLAGNLVICKMVMMHINPVILDHDGKIDPHKIDLVGRMGGELYCRASGEAVIEVHKPVEPPGIGIDRLPDKIRYSKILSGNDLGLLGNIKSMPDENEIKEARLLPEIEGLLRNIKDKVELAVELQKLAKSKIAGHEVELALKILLLKN